MNASPFYRAAIASDVEVIKLMLAQARRSSGRPSEVKKEGDSGERRRAARNANVGKTPLMVALVGGRGAAFGGGPGLQPHRPAAVSRAANRAPLNAVKTLLAAGADPNAKAPDGSTPLHQAVTRGRCRSIRALVAGGAKLDAVNKDNLTPLQLAEKPEAAARGDDTPGSEPDRRSARHERGSHRRASRADGAAPADAEAAAGHEEVEAKKDEKKPDARAGRCAAN